MRTYRISEFGIENLKIVEEEMPRPGPREVLIKFHAASLNYRDLMVVTGTYNPRMKLPAIPFSDAAGEVVEVGADVEKWVPGDRVSPVVISKWFDGGPTAASSRTAIGAGAVDGVLREYGVFEQDSIVAVPHHLSFEEAATLPCAAVTAWHALAVSGRLSKGETVLTLGTGGVSIFAIQFAKHFGARVIVTSGSDQKLERAISIGADHGINYRERPDWDKAVLELTDGLGVDHVIEVGGTGTLARSVKSVRTGGHIALIGALDNEGGFDPIWIFMKGIRVQGIFVGSRRMNEDMNAALEAAQMRPVIDSVFAFEDAPAALRHLASGSHFGKIVVRIEEKFG